ncbi:hypothetical protein MXB_5539 [Myxobolus squamalis]|nr:hypothetical protein MXB_5539 [Myxobolus squamalis]
MHWRALNTSNETNPPKDIPDAQNQTEDKISEDRITIQELTREIKIIQNLRAEALHEVSRVRQRANKEIEEEKHFGCAKIAKDFIEVADVLDRAISIIPEAAIKGSVNEPENAYAKEFINLYHGIVMTRNILSNSFAKNGIAKIEPGLGEFFDPSLHSAKYEIPKKDGGYPPKTIGDVFRVGYSINGRVMRPAEVGVVEYQMTFYTAVRKRVQISIKMVGKYRKNPEIQELVMLAA